jgi:hypothetical protein
MLPPYVHHFAIKDERKMAILFSFGSIIDVHKPIIGKANCLSAHLGPTALSGANGIMQLFAIIRLLVAWVRASLKSCRQAKGG